MICYDRLWKTLIDKHLKKTELRDKIGISNATLAKLGKNEPVNLKVIAVSYTHLTLPTKRIV